MRLCMALCYNYLRFGRNKRFVVLILVLVRVFTRYHCDTKGEINHLYSYYMFALIQLIGCYDLV